LSFSLLYLRILYCAACATGVAMNASEYLREQLGALEKDEFFFQSTCG
jgi:hypothetical protein